MCVCVCLRVCVGCCRVSARKVRPGGQGSWFCVCVYTHACHAYICSHTHVILDYIYLYIYICDTLYLHFCNVMQCKYDIMYMMCMYFLVKGVLVAFHACLCQSFFTLNKCPK